MLYCSAKQKPFKSYNAFHFNRIGNLIAKKDTLMNQHEYPFKMMDSSTWSAKSRLNEIICSFSELELGGGFSFGDGSYTFRREYFTSQIKSFKDAKMWLAVLKQDLRDSSVQSDGEKKA